MPKSQKLLTVIWGVSFARFGVGVKISSAQIWFYSLKYILRPYMQFVQQYVQLGVNMVHELAFLI